jgi:hypothetical protein
MSTAAFVLPGGARRQDAADPFPAQARHGEHAGSRPALRRVGLLAVAAALCAAAFFGTRPSDGLARPTIRPAPPSGVELVVTIPAIRLDLGPLLGLDPAPAAAPGCGG